MEESGHRARQSARETEIDRGGRGEDGDREGYFTYLANVQSTIIVLYVLEVKPEVNGSLV